jgi:predicted ATPase
LARRQGRTPGAGPVAQPWNDCATGAWRGDDVEAALQLKALARIHQLAKGGAQFLIATHSPILMAYPGATILLLEGDRMKSVLYEETDHFRTMRAFLGDYRRALDELLDDDEDQ